jgi:hypothetical protein
LSLEASFNCCGVLKRNPRKSIGLVLKRKAVRLDTKLSTSDGDKALKGALIMLLMMDELRVGDHLTVQRRQRT